MRKGISADDSGPGWRACAFVAFAAVLSTLALAASYGAGQALAHGGHGKNDDKGTASHHVKGTASRLLVDDDKVQCPDAQYTTIQAAVTAASAGDVIGVCPGNYSSTTVDKRVALKGATDGVGGKRCLDRTRGADPATDSIVNGAAGSPGFRVAANGVEIVGFTIQNTANDAGVSVPKTVSDVDVRQNLIQKNTIGVNLNGDDHRVSLNCVRDNNVAGSAAGNGVYSDQGLTDSRIRGNVFTGHENASVILVGGAGTQSHDAVEFNSSVKDAPYIFANVTDSSVSANISSESAGSGIFFGGGSSDVAVKHNRVSKCAFTGINVRFLPASAGGYNVTTNNTDIAIAGNKVAGCGDGGIRLRDGATGNVVRENRVAENGTGATKGDGIALEDADANRVQGNASEGNGRDGLHADAASSGNQIAENRAKGNGEHDCHDDSTGTGTAGTANQWVDDKGDTENKPGLCTPFGDKGVKGDHGDKGDKGDKEHGDKVTMCHKTGNGSFVKLTVSERGARAHDREHRGDIVPAPAGGCPDRVAGAEKTIKHEARDADDDSSDDNAKHDQGDDEHAAKSDHASSADKQHGDKVTVCHKTGNGSFVELTVSKSGARAHDAKHDGDVAPTASGGCPDRVAGAQHTIERGKHHRGDHR